MYLEPGSKLPLGWYWGKLGDALVQRKAYVEIDNGQSYKRVTVQLHGRGVILRDVIQGSNITTKKQYVLHTDDFLVAEIDAKVGGFGIVPAEANEAIVSSHYFIFEVNSELLLLPFLESFIRTGYITKGVSQFVRGSLNYAAIRPHHVLGIDFPFAPKKAQEELIHQMRMIDKAKAAIESQLEAVNALPLALLRHALNGES